MLAKTLVLCMLCSSWAWGGEIPFTSVCRGTDAVYGVKKSAAAPEIVMARDDRALRRIWAEDVTGSSDNLTAYPKIDWENRFAVAVFLGSRPSAGFEVRVKKLVIKDTVLEMEVEETKPPPDAVSAAVITSPYEVVSCRRKDSAIEQVLMLKLVGPDGRVIVERPAWSFRVMEILNPNSNSHKL